jgi:hypothetical protein
MRNVIIISVLTFTVFLFAGEPLGDDIHTIALYKNGSGYFLSTVDIAEGSEEFSIVPEVAATNGTFWVSWPQDVKVNSIVARERDFEEEIDAVTIIELLKANVGARVKLTIADETVTGELIRFDEKEISPGPRPYMPGSGNVMPEIKAKMISVETDAGILVVDAQRVSGVSFLRGELSRNTTQTVKKVVLTGDFAAKTPETKVDISYLGKGITWVPSYSVDITDGDKATLSAKALIINEAADLADVKILLITGYPQLEFADVFSPMAVKSSLAGYLGSLAKGGGCDRGYQGVTSNMLKSNGRFDMVAESAAPINYGSGAAGKQIEDMFFYPLENVTLEKDGTGYYPLFSEQVDTRHIYQWDIANSIDGYNRYSGDNRPQEQTVWHCIELHNDTGRPWTTGAIETKKQGLILGQSILDFTLDNDKAMVKITRANAVKANQVEYVSKRVPNSASFFGTNYDEVTIEGTLEINNTKGEAINLNVSKMISGKLLSSSPRAKVRKTSDGVGQINETQELKWDIAAQASEKVEINYSYKAYLRR